ncbi:7SK snRNA methylphosphate capping enzyme bin3 [Sitodiplosis mosellana]|uniref:7SK snRNA methylphosphate capping enzyme bin3 n=1 Tax=Sitodiplosis mosellana TaxID=263140 RepID=UPI0024442F51|nr:7SK snRNA methylphosphate capping enzyme bin3 [Sitodiplosis mosellana]XP_055300684.1 7SK snRNA methylphosphate capping enzyme bin3 [Sitodiplosis mosellana]
MAENTTSTEAAAEQDVLPKENHPKCSFTENNSHSPKKRASDSQPNSSPSKKLRLELPKPVTNGHEKFNGAKNKNKFIYGNYNRYYGYRCEKNVEDVRLNALIQYEELFIGKEIVDIGCNDGSLTIALAKRLPINFISGIDIDANLIGKARRSVVHETQAIVNNNDKNVIKQANFPNNIAFKQCNYVLSNDSLLELDEPRYDTILCLSVTKWIHLNFGDDGLKRAFKRMYRQLKENGTLILEAQDWKSYKRRKNLTPEINLHYKNIQLVPKQFHDYLMSSEIGFESFYAIKLPQEHSANGFKRPVIAYKKGKGSTSS